jgi:hypothetical protein
MMPDKVKSIISSLIERTNSKDVKWSKTYNSNEFKVNLKNGAITIKKWMEDKQIESIEVAMYNNSDEKIESYKFRNGDSEFLYLTSFYEIVRNDVLKVDELLSNLYYDILDTKPPPDEPDKLPFDETDGLPF